MALAGSSIIHAFYLHLWILSPVYLHSWDLNSLATGNYNFEITRVQETDFPRQAGSRSNMVICRIKIWQLTWICTKIHETLGSFHSTLTKFGSLN